MTEHECKPVQARGRPAKLQAAQIEVIRRLVSQHPQCTVNELAQLLAKDSGVRVSTVTLTKGLKQAGIVRVKPEAQVGYAQAEATTPRRYGYTAQHRDAGDAQRYATSLSDAEWALVCDLFESAPAHAGKPPTYSRRVMVDACCYVVRTGCSWRLLPKSFPHWDSVYKTFRRWSEQGRFERMHDRLREQWRQRAGRDVAPTIAVLDSQSTRGSPQGGPSGFDAGKRVKGRKRNVVVDSMGLVLAVVVTAASVQDRDGARPAMAIACAKYTSIETLFVDSAYAGQCAQYLQQEHGLTVQVVRHPGNRSVGRWHDQQLPLFEAHATRAFTALPMRWIVERTHAWVERARRLVMHHDRRLDVSTAWVWLSEARRLMRGLTTVHAA